ncbi:MAG: hypothetical protein OXP12_07320 [Thaumarchaeota archaeon]|nr:hypothetical protein [Nitrososphaerota archaeon]MDE0526451.1 hypothetical protein [Nitrososphaerota archaeon]
MDSAHETVKQELIDKILSVMHTTNGEKEVIEEHAQKEALGDFIRLVSQFMPQTTEDGLRGLYDTVYLCSLAKMLDDVRANPNALKPRQSPTAG